MDTYSLKTRPLDGGTVISHLINSLTLRVDKQSGLNWPSCDLHCWWGWSKLITLPIPMRLISSVLGKATVRKSMSGPKLGSSLCQWHLDLCIYQSYHCPRTLLIHQMSSAVSSTMENHFLQSNRNRTKLVKNFWRMSLHFFSSDVSTLCIFLFIYLLPSFTNKHICLWILLAKDSRYCKWNPLTHLHCPFYKKSQ